MLLMEINPHHSAEDRDMKDIIENAFFNEDIIKQCILDSFLKRLWGAWKVLTGQAGILLLVIKKKDFYK